MYSSSYQSRVLILKYANTFAIKKSELLHGIEYRLTLLHSERPKLYTILAFLSAIGLTKQNFQDQFQQIFENSEFIQLFNKPKYSFQ